jgi:hypothetical protein
MKRYRMPVYTTRPYGIGKPVEFHLPASHLEIRDLSKPLAAAGRL